MACGGSKEGELAWVALKQESAAMVDPGGNKAGAQGRHLGAVQVPQHLKEHSLDSLLEAVESRSNSGSGKTMVLLVNIRILIASKKESANSIQNDLVSSYLMVQKNGPKCCKWLFKWTKVNFWSS
ncbi:UNVERIFIED_CONTAM: hypothetical protein K2H54_015534 [Gekko kuhli]